MKKIILFSVLIFGLFFVGCSTTNDEVLKSCGPFEDGDSWNENCNSCVCSDGDVICSDKLCVNGNDKLDNESFNFGEVLDDIKFNTDLTSYEKDWLGYLEVKYPFSKIYHIKTQIINCENCYTISYKKDREIVKIKVIDGKKTSETTVIDDIVVDIENADVCSLFQGEWNDCPKLCNTNEVACQNECGLPICEFDYNKIVFKKIGDICGGLDEGDCEFGLTCVYENRSSDKYGTCKNK